MKGSAAKKMSKMVGYAMVLLCAYSAAAQVPAQAFTVHIVQDGKEISQAGGVSLLKKEPFTLVFELDTPIAILVNASFNNASYQAAKQGLPLESVQGFTETGMAEGTFNSEKDIMVNDMAPSYWYYDGPKDHRFDSVAVKDGHYTYYRTIANTYEVKNHKAKPIRKVGDPLNLVFAVFDWSGEPGGLKTEYHRAFVQIQWVK